VSLIIKHSNIIYTYTCHLLEIIENSYVGTFLLITSSTVLLEIIISTLQNVPIYKAFINTISVPSLKGLFDTVDNHTFIDFYQRSLILFYYLLYCALFQFYIAV